MSKSCEGFKDCVDAYIDGELQISDLRKWEDHLSMCEKCMLLHRDCLRQRKLLISLEEEALPEHFQSSLHEKILREKAHAYSTSIKSKRHMRTVTFLSGLAASVIIIYGAFMLREDFNDKVNDVVISDSSFEGRLDQTVDSNDIEIAKENGNTKQAAKLPIKDNERNLSSEVNEVSEEFDNLYSSESNVALEDASVKESKEQGTAINRKQQDTATNSKEQSMATNSKEQGMAINNKEQGMATNETNQSVSRNRAKQLEQEYSINQRESTQSVEEYTIKQSKEQSAVINKEDKSARSSTTNKSTTSTTTNKSATSTIIDQNVSKNIEGQGEQEALPNQRETMPSKEKNSIKPNIEENSTSYSIAESSMVQQDSRVDEPIRREEVSAEENLSRKGQELSNDESDQLSVNTGLVRYSESFELPNERDTSSQRITEDTQIQLRFNGERFNWKVGDFEVINEKKNLYGMEILVQKLDKEGFSAFIGDLNALLGKDLQKTKLEETKALRYEVTLTGRRYNRFIGDLEGYFTKEEMTIPLANSDWNVILTFLQE